MKKQVFLFTAILGMTLIGCQSQENLVSLADEANVVTSIPRSQLKKLKTIKEQKTTPVTAQRKTVSFASDQKGNAMHDTIPYVVDVTGNKGIAKSISTLTLAPIPGKSFHMEGLKTWPNFDAQNQVNQVEIDAAADRIFISLCDSLVHYYIFKYDGSFVTEFAKEMTDYSPSFVVDREYHQLVMTADNKVAVYDYDGHLLSLTPMRYAATSARRLGDYWFCCPAGSSAWQYQEYPVVSTNKLSDKQKQLLIGDDAGRNTDYVYPLYKDSAMNKPADIVHCGFLTDANFTPVSKIMHTYPKTYKSRSTGLSQQFQNINEHLFFQPANEDHGVMRYNEMQIFEDEVSDEAGYKVPTGVNGLRVPDPNTNEVIEYLCDEVQPVSGGKNFTYYTHAGGLTLGADMIFDRYDRNECYCAGSSANGGVYYYDNGTFWQMHPTYAVPVVTLDKPRFVTAFKMADRFLLANSVNFAFRTTLVSRTTGKEFVSNVEAKEKNFDATLLKSTISKGTWIYPIDITLDGKLVFVADPLTIKKKAMEQYDSWSEDDKQRLHDIDPKGSITLIFVTPKDESEWKPW